MPVTPTSSLAKALDNCKSLIAATPAFQAWGSFADAAAAKANIHLFAVDQLARPLIVLGVNEYDRTKIAEPNTYQERGAFELLIEGLVPAELTATNGDAAIDFMNKAGAVIDDILALAGTGSYLVIRSIVPAAGPFRSEEEVKAAEGDFFQWFLTLKWGN